MPQALRLLRHLQRRLRRQQALVHRLERGGGARLGAHEDHAAAAVAHQVPGAVVVAHDRVDGALAPPADAQAHDALGEGGHPLLGGEEVAVVELDAVDAVACLAASGSSRPCASAPRQPARPVGLGDRAERAGEGAALAGMVGDGAAAEHGAAQVARHVHLLVGQRREAVEVGQRRGRGCAPPGRLCARIRPLMLSSGPPVSSASSSSRMVSSPWLRTT